MNFSCIIALAFLALGCSTEKNQKVKEISKAEQDSLMNLYLKKTFPHDMLFTQKENYSSEVTSQEPPDKEVLLYPGPFKLRYYHFGDGQSYSSFVVKIQKTDSFVTFFSFSDELYYLNNSNRFDLEKLTTLADTSGDAKFLNYKNLEINLNTLIHQMNYQNDQTQIMNLMRVLFEDLLKMYPLRDAHRLRSSIDELEKRNRNGVLDPTIQEYRYACGKTSRGNSLVYQVKEGLDGYWILEIEQRGNSYYVKPSFAGDATYQSFYF